MGPLLLLLPRGKPLLLLVGAAAAAVLLGCCSGCSSHSMRYLCTGVSEPSHGLPLFIAVGYVDEQPIVKYDSETETSVCQASWIMKAKKDNSQYWEKINQEFLKLDMKFSQHLLDLQVQYNQSRGFHTLQLMYGCELSPDGRKGGYWRYGYDGRDFLSFDKETRTWMGADRKAQATKREWDVDLATNQRNKAYLEEICVAWLRRYLDYGNETLLRTERPVGNVTHQPRLDGQETLICQAYGFYPRPIDTTWRRDGEVMEHATFRRDVAPNSDRTYHAWLSIDVDPQDKNHYSCHIEHDGLPEPLVLAWEEPAKVGHSLPILEIFWRALVAVVVAGAVVAAVICVCNDLWNTIPRVNPNLSASRPPATSSEKIRKKATYERTSTRSQEPAISPCSAVGDIQASPEIIVLQGRRPSHHHLL